MLQTGKLASGMVGAEVEFLFSDEWKPLIKTAVFIAGDEKRVVFEAEWRDNICTIPHECLAKPDVHLLAGVYGTNSGGSLVIPTVYADLGIIWPGADTEGETGAAASPELWAQLKAQFDLAEKTENKATELSSASTDGQYPSAKAVYDAIAASRDVLIIAGTLGADQSTITVTTPNAFQLVAEAWSDAKHPLVAFRIDDEAYAYLSAFSADPAMAIFSIPAAKLFHSTPPRTIILDGGNTAMMLEALDSQMSDTSTAAVQNKVVKKYVDDKTFAKEDISNKISAITADSTDGEYPSAKAVRDYVAANAGGGGSKEIEILTGMYDPDGDDVVTLDAVPEGATPCELIKSILDTGKWPVLKMTNPAGDWYAYFTLCRFDDTNGTYQFSSYELADETPQERLQIIEFYPAYADGHYEFFTPQEAEHPVTIYIRSNIMGQGGAEPPVTLPKGSTWADFCAKNPYGMELSYGDNFVQVNNIGGGGAQFFEDCRFKVNCGGLDRLIDGKTYYLYGE